MQTIPLFHGAEWLLLSGGEGEPAPGGLRTFLMTRTFAAYESYDLVVFGGQGVGPPDLPIPSDDFDFRGRLASRRFG